jgi:hypothetical protein
MSCESMRPYCIKQVLILRLRIVHVFDPTDKDRTQIPIGKQTLDRGGMIWYTPCSGIWQTVWLEPVPTAHVAKLDLSADMNGQGMGL